MRNARHSRYRCVPTHRLVVVAVAGLAAALLGWLGGLDLTAVGGAAVAIGSLGLVIFGAAPAAPAVAETEPGRPEPSGGEAAAAGAGGVGGPGESAAGTLAEVTKLQEAVQLGAAMTSEQVTAVLSEIEQVSANINAIAQASTDLDTAIGQISDRATAATVAGVSAADSADTARSTMADLDRICHEVDGVVGFITTIARRTNMLALNASIEANRAGEAGRGFSVVATEVKELAEQARQASEEIGRRIQEIQTGMQGAVLSVNDISESVAAVTDSQSSIATAVEEQHEAAALIADNASTASEKGDGTALMFGGIAAGADGLVKSAEQIGSLVQQLVQEEPAVGV